MMKVELNELGPSRSNSQPISIPAEKQQNNTQ